MDLTPIRQQIERELTDNLRRVMAGDECVPYDVAVEVASRAARMAGHLVANNLFRQKQLEVCTMAAAKLIAADGDWSPRAQGHAAAIAVSLSELVAIAVAELNRVGGNEDAEGDKDGGGRRCSQGEGPCCEARD